jgi:hypothetical protein
MLHGQKVLSNRLNAVKAHRRAVGARDETPTIADIEKTHLLYTNATFKPFVQTTSEYRKEKAPGQYTLGDEVTFEIKHFGDFFADMVLYIKLDASNLVTYTTDEAGGDNRPLVRWCNYPGERILQEVSFEVNGNEIDKYHPEDCVIYRNCNLPINKRKAYKKLMGQETSEEGYFSRDHLMANAEGSLDQRVKVSLCRGLQTPKFNPVEEVELWIPLKFWFNMSFKQAIPSVAMPSGNRCIKIQLADVNQLVGLVPRGVPCVFDNAWAKDSDFSVFTGASETDANASIDSSKLLIKDLSLWVNHLFVHPEIHEIYLSRIGFSLVRVHKKQKKTVSDDNEEHKMNDLKWPIETLYIGLKPKEYDDSDATNRAHHLDKWDSYSLLEKERHNVLEALPVAFNVADAGDATDVSFNWVAGGLHSSQLLTGGTGDDAIDNFLEVGGCYIAVWKNTETGGQMAFNFVVNALDESTVTLKGRHPNYSDTSLYPHYDPQYGQILAYNVFGDFSTNPMTTSALQVENYRRVNMVDNIKVTLHGIDILDSMKSTFLSTYVPFKYGGFNINPPEDPGIHMVNFALHPGQYQPSGHVNISRAREFYISYTSSVVGFDRKSDSTKTQQAEMHVLTKAINFLLVSDGSAILRYMT